MKEVRTCKFCNKKFKPFMATCIQCMGEGEVDSFNQPRTCYICGGTGEIIEKELCPDCRKEREYVIFPGAGAE